MEEAIGWGLTDGLELAEHSGRVTACRGQAGG